MKSNPIRRGLPVLALAALALSPAAQAATLVDITFSPQGGALTTLDYGYLGTTSEGTFATTTVNGLQSVATASPAIPTNTGVGLPGSTVYSFSVSGITVDASPGHTLTWDITLTAGATVAGVGPTLGVDGGPNRGWAVDHTGSSTRFDPGETLSFVVSNVLLDGGAGASFTGFTGWTQDVGTLVGTPSLNTYDFTSTSAARLRSIDFGFSTEVIPEPSTALLGGLGLLGLLARRRRA